MSSRSYSPFEGHATPMQSQKTSTKAVAQRRVYGKRRKNAARAIFVERSPVKETSPPRTKSDDTVDALQLKLAEVTIQEEQVSSSDEIDSAAEVSQTEEKDDTLEPSSSVASQQADSIPQTSPAKSPEEVLEKPKPYETMVEVRISTRTQQATPSQPQEKSSIASTERRAPRQKIPIGRRSSGVVHDNKANTYVRPILNEALSSLASQTIQKFSTWASRSVTMFHVAKLAEGSYGEVYKLHLREENSRPAVSKSRLAKLQAYGDGVFKVVPLRAQTGPGSKKFTTIDEIVSEVKMLKYLDPIPGFARFREIHVVQGRFPETFQSAWDHYKKTKDDCMNPNPSSKKAYPDTQLWAIVEMDDAGCELEKFKWASTFQIYDIFWGVAMALARAEEYALFEHRDLHLGNVCIRSTRPDGSMEPPTELEVARLQSSSGFGFSSLETTIIDYSLSRADLRLADLPDDPEGLVEIASSDLDRKQIFDAIGHDEDEILLRNTYRYMRATVYTGNPAEAEKIPDIKGIWAEYAPRTNLVWLLFILKNLLKNKKSEAPQPVVPAQRKALAPCSPNRKMTEGGSVKSKSIKEHDAAGSLVKERQAKDFSARVSKLKQTLEDRLYSVLELLDIEHGHEDMCCAADLVAYAMDSQWLAQQDFF
ncbi:uncharacterized protein N7443_009113 [Penicillium atrosanguineum]|uniref:uncharacterized protein n=1 Tax=Penicillium atrosanguineum TaxID=1132637 RepID=UPI0023A5BFFA|nr:uncharacterized protein N7443_009113 [Penicillium atrosanguineum]KAJ5293160.1 hypothetical protein N7443_009113 [Penicillium atrosanguineum]